MSESFTRFDAAKYLKTPFEMAPIWMLASKKMLATVC